MSTRDSAIVKQHRRVMTHFKFVALLTLILSVSISCSGNSMRFSADTDPSVADMPEAALEPADNAYEDTISSQVDSSYIEYSYVDEGILSQIDLAEENYTMGYAATLDSNWLEAQFYFESALEVLARLEIEPDDPSGAAGIYDTLLNEIISDYKRTLIHIATLPTESSPDAVIARYEELDSIVGPPVVDTQHVATKPEKVEYDFPIVMNDRVRRALSYWQGEARKPMEAALQRSGRYLPMMERVLEEVGIPHDLVYLPLLESGFKTSAYSWAHASGPWQFVSGTARLYGLERSWWYDERRDFERSTHAAARHLKDLHAQTKDWYLALLGYDAGLGNVNKMIRHNGTRDYFKMRIRNREMRNYVPLYIAALLIAKEPEKYGFYIDYDDPMIFDTVTVERCLALEDIAKAVGCTYSELKDLNPELLRKYTPPDKKQYTLRIPHRKTGAFWAAYSKMKSPEETSWVQHRVRKGETVSAIAKKYGVSQWAIIDANNMRRPYRINIGQKIIVPVPLGRGRSTGYAQKNRDYRMTGDVYIVRRGDTLWDLARAFGTTTRSLRNANNLSRSGRIYIGQKLRIPGMSSNATASSSGGPSSYTGPVFSYKVKRGDNLWEISQKHGTTVNRLCGINGISRNSNLAVGQILMIPGSGGKSDRGTVSYIVRRGDNLWELAQRYGTTVSSIRNANGLSRRSVLRVGQKLKIPGVGNLTTRSSYHVVRRGDTLSAIAKRYGVSLNSLMVWNSIRNPDRLSVGDRIKVSAN
jgi:membrane-bound lytic murein transglycosylase D